jgi:hypothetical protein
MECRDYRWNIRSNTVTRRNIGTTVARWSIGTLNRVSRRDEGALNTVCRWNIGSMVTRWNIGTLNRVIADGTKGL